MTTMIEIRFSLFSPSLGNEQVSWIRHRDLHILTVGTYTYTTDQRFTTTHHKETDEWTLQIKFAQKRDAGLYDCQISTQPIKSYAVRLNLVGECEMGLKAMHLARWRSSSKTKFLTLQHGNCDSENIVCCEALDVTRNH